MKIDTENLPPDDLKRKSKPTYGGWQIAGSVVGLIASGVYFIFFFDAKAMVKLLASAAIGPVFLSCLFFLAAVVIRVVKWTYLLNIRDKVVFKDGYHAVMISNMVNFLFPVRIGEVLKLYIIHRSSGIAYSASASAILMDRFSQLLVMALLLILLPLAGFNFMKWKVEVFLVLILMFFLMLLLFVFGDRVLGFLENTLARIFPRLRAVFSGGNKGIVGRFFAFIKEILGRINLRHFSVRNLITVGLFSVVVILVDGLCYLFIMAAFGVSISWFQGALASCLMCLTFILPTPPAMVGTAEMYPVIIFSWGLGLPAMAVSTAALLWHFLTIGIIVLLGVSSLSASGVQLKKLLNKLKSEHVEDPG